MTKMNNITNKELLYRIDERQQVIMKAITSIQESVEERVMNDEEYKEMRKKVEMLWEAQIQLKTIVKMAIAIGGFVGGVAASLVTYFITNFI